jgi:hypothetical protein
MRYLRVISIFLGALASFSCSNVPTSVIEDISRGILIKEYPGKGVFTLRLQSPDLAQGAEQACNPTGNEYLQILCDAEAACAATSGADKLVCIYDEMKKPIGEYERSLKSNKYREEKVSKHHDSGAFGAWKDVKEIHQELRHFVNEYRGGGDDEEGHEESDDDADEHDEFVEKIQKIYNMIQRVKEKYGPQGNLQIPVEIKRVEVLHPVQGWVALNDDDVELDLAVPDLNRVIALGVLEPVKYTAVRVSFGPVTAIRVRNPALLNMYQKGTLPPGINLDGEWVIYPLTYADAGDTGVRIITETLPISVSKALELGISLDLKNSVYQNEGKYYFDPAFFVTGITGDEYLAPDQPVNVSLDQGNLEIRADANTLDRPIRFEATPIAPADLPSQAEEGAVILGAYDMQPGMVFNKSVELKFKYNPSLMTERGFKAENIRARYYHEDRKRWIDIPSFSVDEAAGTVTVYTNHFTIISVVGVPGFRLSYPNGITGKIAFSALNYTLSRIGSLMRVKVPVDDLPFNMEKNGAHVIGKLSGTMLEPRNIAVTVAKSASSGNTIKVNIKNTDEIYLGKLELEIYGYILNTYCLKEKEKCDAGCSDWHKSLRWICKNSCIDGYHLCNINVAKADSLNLINGANITNLSLDLNYEVNRDPNSGAISVSFLGATTQNLTFDLKDRSLWDKFLWFPFIKELITEKIEDYLNKPSSGVGDQIGAEIGPKIQEQLNKSLADSKATTPFIIDDNGIELYNDITTDIPPVPAININGKNINGVCNPGVGFPEIGDLPNSPINLAGAADIGLAFNLTAFNQVFNEMANRGYFCYNLETDPITKSGISLQPNGPPTLRYLGNHLTLLRFPVMGRLMSYGTTIASQNGTLDIYYRFSINMGGNAISMGAAKFLADFPNGAVRTAVNNLVVQINALIEANPTRFGFSMNFGNPLNYTVFQPSTFRMDMMEEINGLLTFGINMRGLRIDYAGEGWDSEWIWTKAWTGANTKCSTFSRGVIGKIPGTPYYKLSLENGQVIAAVNDGVPPVLFDSILNNNVTVEGECLYGSIPFYTIRNVVDDHFFMRPPGTLLKKSNYAAQAVTGFSETVGLYEANITGNALPEILQVTQPASGQYRLEWILSNNCCWSAPYNTTRYVMPLPADINSSGLYRVNVIKMASGFDQVLLNCNVYNASVAGGQVQLQLANRICTDPYAGMVVDDRNSLMWTRCVMGQGMYDPDCAGSARTFTNYSQASDACTSLEHAGFNDWRLPSSSELQATTPQNPSAPFFVDPNGRYWISDFNYSRLTVQAEVIGHALIRQGGDKTLYPYFGWISAGSFAESRLTGAGVEYALYRPYLEYHDTNLQKPANTSGTYMLYLGRIGYDWHDDSDQDLHDGLVEEATPILDSMLGSIAPNRTRCVRSMN